MLFEDQKEARQPGPEILESEVQQALKAMKNREIPGHDRSS